VTCNISENEKKGKISTFAGDRFMESGTDRRRQVNKLNEFIGKRLALNVRNCCFC
jgi:hypothetical protein